MCVVDQACGQGAYKKLGKDYPPALLPGMKREKKV